MRMMAREKPALLPKAVARRNELVLKHIGLVKSLASRLARRIPAQVDVEELVGVGIVGLIDAASRFDPSLNVPFDAFARRRIHGAMLDALRGMDWAPRAVRKMRRDVDAAVSTARHREHREPTEIEIAKELNVSVPEYEKMLDQIRAVDLASIRQLDSSASGSPVFEVALDPGEGPLAKLERVEMRDHLARAVATLPERERQILSLYYEKELTLAEIGAVIGVGESRVSQLRSQAVARLRSQMRETLQLTEIG